MKKYTPYIITVISIVLFLSCIKSKKQVVEGLLQRQKFWGDRRLYYSNIAHQLELYMYRTDPPTMPSDTLILYSAITDTAEWHLDEINDSLYKITGEQKYGHRK